MKISLNRSTRSVSDGQKEKNYDAWPIYGEKELFPVSMFSDTVFLNFEGARYPAPALYDQYLTALYGDYRKDPPIEKQVTHHAYKAYWK